MLLRRIPPYTDTLTQALITFHPGWQILPQLLFFLYEARRVEPAQQLDWATVAFFTCIANCSADSIAVGGSAYTQEYAYVQVQSEEL